MSCKYTFRDIGRYLFNKMTPDEETEFQFHLSQCSKCQSELQAIRDLTEELKDKKTEANTKTVPFKRHIHLYRYIVAASVILLCGLGIAFYYSSDTLTTQEALVPDTYLYQDSVNNTQDTLSQTTNKDSL